MQGPKWHPLAVVPPSCNTMMPKDPESSQKIHHPPFQHPPGYVPKNNKHQSQSNTRPDRNPKSLKVRALPTKALERHFHAVMLLVKLYGVH